MRAPAAIAAVLAAAAWAPGAALGAEHDGVERLGTVERAIEEGLSRERELDSKAAELEREIVGLRATLVTTARAVQDHEERLSALERRVADLSRTEVEKRAKLKRKWSELTATLGALERISRQPPSAIVAAPATVTDAIRTNLLLKAVVPALAGVADKLRRQLDGLAALRRLIAAERARIGAAGSELKTERRRVDTLLGRASTIRRTTLKERQLAEQRVARLAAEAKTLRELMERLAAAPPPKVATPALAPLPTVRSFTAARGTLPLPVRGDLVGFFGQPEESGGRTTGIAIASRAGAQVVTPYDGRVVFVGPFRGYGQLLIIEHGEGYHTVLAGVARIDSVLDQWLLAGEPVGVMGPGSRGNPILYVELRRNGAAINPLPWLAADGRKVSG